MKLFSFNKEITIAKKLKEDGFSPLNGKDSYGNELAEAYVEQHYKPQFIKVTGKHSKEEIADKLKKKSEEVLKTSYKSEDKKIYLLAQRGCVKPHKIKERAEKLGFTFLNTDEKSDEDREIGEIRVLDYKHFKEEIDLEGGISRTEDLSKKISILKTIARDMISKKNYDEKSNLYWNTVIRWFTKKRP